jgi:2-phospho-L-lactate guanylyltransferase
VTEPGRHWCLVVPVKRLDRAKTRLAGRYGDRRRDLALAFAVDTVTAALACPVVDAVLVVTDDEQAAQRLAAAGAEVTGDDPDAGLNPALVHGAELVARRHPGTRVGTLAADLPALRPDELGAALARAEGLDRGFVRDAEGTGTTLLLASRAASLRPSFGTGSAARHALDGAVEIDASDLPTLRADVDLPGDLRTAAALGLGATTAGLLGAAAGPGLPGDGR